MIGVAFTVVFGWNTFRRHLVIHQLLLVPSSGVRHSRFETHLQFIFNALNRQQNEFSAIRVIAAYIATTATLETWIFQLKLCWCDWNLNLHNTNSFRRMARPLQNESLSRLGVVVPLLTRKSTEMNSQNCSGISDHQNSASVKNRVVKSNSLENRAKHTASVKSIEPKYIRVHHSSLHDISLTNQLNVQQRWNISEGSKKVKMEITIKSAR